MQIAVEGCCHGELDKIYEAIDQQKVNVNLLIICGDFQAVRNRHDMRSLAVPQKYQKLGCFADYYTGKKIAPLLTLFIGGNHEASNYLSELYYGGWVCPNIYYIGTAGAINYKGLRIAGLSGIYKHHDYHKGHFEIPPYNSSELRSVYHIREFAVRKLMHLSHPVSIMLSHDWPNGIYHYGNLDTLLKRKPFFRADIAKGALGSPPARILLDWIKPAYWFSSHLHNRFTAQVNHVGDKKDACAENSVVNPDEILIELSDEYEDVGALSSHPPANDDGPQYKKIKGEKAEAHLSDEKISFNHDSRLHAAPTGFNTTKFLALDKCLPRRQFLEIMTIPETVFSETLPPTLSYDPEWCAITRAYDGYLSLGYSSELMPDHHSMQEAIEREKTWVHEHIHDFSIPLNFQSIAPGVDSASPTQDFYENNQTVQFCDLLGLSRSVCNRSK